MAIPTKTLTDSVFDDPGFPVTVRRILRHGPAEPHRHEFHELVIIVSGKGRHLAGNDNYPISAGDVFVIKGDTAHGYEDTEALGLVNVLFYADRLSLPMADLRRVPGYHTLFTVEPRLRQDDRFRSRLRLTSEQLAEAAQVVAHLEDELTTRGPGYRFMVRTHLMNLIGFVSRCYSQPEQAQHPHLFRIGEVLSFMETHYREPITVAQLAARAGMSESTLSRKFRKVMGCSPIAHLLHVRTARARALLEVDTMNITEIAFACGFNDANYFSRQFRRITGQSPRSYRNATRHL